MFSPEQTRIAESVPSKSRGSVGRIGYSENLVTYSKPAKHADYEQKLTPAQRARFEAAAARALTERRLRRLLTNLVVAADRMRDDWAEGDDAVKKSLWTKLHTAAEAAYDEVYPLPSENARIDGQADD